MDSLITQDIFKKGYLENIPKNYYWQKTPIQTYPLSFLRNHLKLPLPNLRTDYNFLFYNNEGSLSNRIGNELYNVNANSLTFVSAGSISSLQKVSQDLKGYFMLIEDKTMSLLFNQYELLNVFMIEPIIKLNNQESKWIQTICRLLHSELNTPSPNMQIASNLVQALLHKILGLSGKKNSTSRAEQIAINFKKLVHQHYIIHKQISYYSDLMAVSSNYLNRCVKSVFHKSCKEILLETIILNSQILLADPTKTISEISYDLNFNDLSHFTKLFKTFTGQSPSVYRSKILHGFYK